MLKFQKTIAIIQLGINGVTLYGLNHKTVVYLLEQFDSVQFFSKYKNKYIQRANENEASGLLFF